MWKGFPDNKLHCSINYGKFLVQRIQVKATGLLKFIILIV